METKPEKQSSVGRKELSDRNRVFLDKLADGVPTVDAYRLAGYTGSPHTAYELKRQLKQELRNVLEARGYSMEGLASEILNLTKLPVDLTKYPNGIPLSQKIQILKLFAGTLKGDSPRAAGPQSVTAFIIQREAPAPQPQRAAPLEAQDAEIVTPDNVMEDGKTDERGKQ